MSYGAPPPGGGWEQPPPYGPPQQQGQWPPKPPKSGAEIFVTILLWTVAVLVGLTVIGGILAIIIFGLIINACTHH